MEEVPRSFTKTPEFHHHYDQLVLVSVPSNVLVVLYRNLQLKVEAPEGARRVVFLCELDDLGEVEYQDGARGWHLLDVWVCLS